jgi:hypothetical protein
MIGEYNTQRQDIIFREYGRHVQKLIDHIRETPDKERRTLMAHALIDLIRQLTPSLKDQPDNPQRLWDDLFVMADFNLDIDSPYPIPDRETIFKKPMRVEYPQGNVRYKHYGKNLEGLVKEALKISDPQEREEAVIYLGKLMKTFFATWNKEVLDDSVILKDIKVLSGGELSMNIEKVREDNLFEKLYRDRKKPFQPNSGQNSNRPQNGGGQRHHGKRPFNKNRNNNPHRRRDQ